MAKIASDIKIKNITKKTFDFPLSPKILKKKIIFIF